MDEVTAGPYSFTPLEKSSVDKDFRKYQAIVKRCATIQKENEMLVNRIYNVKKLVRKLRWHRSLLKRELELHGDGFHNIPLTFSVDDQQQVSKKERQERDKNAPKLPSNAFLQFCQDQREKTHAQYLQETGHPPDRKVLTKLLATTWNSMLQEEKKVYIGRFLKDRERYQEEMKAYENK